MPKCPYCGEEIDFLEPIEVVPGGALFPNGTYESPGPGATGSIIGYACPYCGEEIASTEEEALRFLNKED